MPTRFNSLYIVRDNKVWRTRLQGIPKQMHGVPVFRGTRVPIQTLFDYIEGGDTLESFLEGVSNGLPRTGY